MPNTKTWTDPDSANAEQVPGQNPLGAFLLSPSSLLAADFNVNGQNVMLNSAPVVIASDQTAIPVKLPYLEQAALTASALNADLLASTDVSAYKWWSFQATALATGGTLSFQCSNDNVTFFNAIAFTAGSTGSPIVSVSGTGVFCGPVNYRYLRIRQTAWTSGASTGVVELYTSPSVFNPSITSVNQNGPWNVGMAPATSGGTSDYHVVSAATTNAASVKASAGQVYGWDAYNAAASVRYVKLYNKASAPTPGTDTPVRTIAIPAGAKAFNVIENGMPFALGIGIAITSGIADNDNTAIAANDVVLDLDWK